MSLLIDASDITHSIQLAVAPVFLLTAVGGMISAVAVRLARIIDRARVVEAQVRAEVRAHPEAVADPENETIPRGLEELGILRRRGSLANTCLGLLTLCGFLIGLTIVWLFLGETTNFRGHTWALWSFLSGVISFLLALVLFFLETILATHVLNQHLLQPEALARLARGAQAARLHKEE